MVRDTISSGQIQWTAHGNTNEPSRTLFHKLNTNIKLILPLGGLRGRAYLKSLVVLLGMILIKEYKEISQQEEC